jgi:hypothetical protein
LRCHINPKVNINININNNRGEPAIQGCVSAWLSLQIVLHLRILEGPGGKHMAGIDRRRLLKLSGAGALAASSGGMAAIFAAGRAPAYAQGTELHWLRWSDFVPASDILLKEQIVRSARRRSASS